MRAVQSIVLMLMLFFMLGMGALGVLLVQHSYEPDKTPRVVAGALERVSNYILAPDRLKRFFMTDVARGFVPDAPAGWTQRNFKSGGLGALMPGSLSDPYRPATPSDLRQLDRSGFDRHGWVYESPTGIMALTIRQWHTEGSRNGRTLSHLKGQDVDHLATGLTPQDRGWAVIQGVPFVRRDLPGGRGRKVRVFLGLMGEDQGIRIAVRARANDADVRMLLERIDYDGLNAWFDPPLPGIGTHSTPVPPGEQGFAAQAAFHRYRDR